MALYRVNYRRQAQLHEAYNLKPDTKNQREISPPPPPPTLTPLISIPAQKRGKKSGKEFPAPIVNCT